MKYSLVQDKLSQMSVSKSNTIKQKPKSIQFNNCRRCKVSVIIFNWIELNNNTNFATSAVIELNWLNIELNGVE